ncbi:Uncharacterized protein TCM_010771 isoform 2 [Theobroma cacao]|uniref:Uncharacterized protein isoform 2 n=1 Tax=Theobroma cacao TaxID=3641 RepID=A0A061E7A4_THECC|nr:Uncharacterized protein TCM_010771 isoform 2 [Theobroma cacao]
MGDSQVQTEAEQPPPAQIPLLNSNNRNDTAQTQLLRRDQEYRIGDDLDDSLEKLERFLSFLGFNQSSLLSCSLSWAAFSVVGVLVPVLVLELSKCDGCETYQIKDFEMDIVASQACLAAVSLFCVSFNLRKYGIRRFLFLDRYGGQMARFTNLYVKQIWDSMRLLIWWSLPCFILKTAREIIRILYVQRDSRLRHHLSKISHRFRIFLLLEFLVVTASQFVTLFQTTGYSGMVNFINGGDFAVSSIVQVVGIILCLHAATKISHRAQGIASLASRWHALATCTSTEASLRGSNSVGNMEAFNQLNSLRMTFSESDLESVDYVAMPTTTQLASYVSSYHRRQAFGMKFILFLFLFCFSILNLKI